MRCLPTQERLCFVDPKRQAHDRQRQVEHFNCQPRWRRDVSWHVVEVLQRQEAPVPGHDGVVRLQLDVVLPQAADKPTPNRIIVNARDPADHGRRL